MALPLYLALTAAEFQNCSSLPTHTGWMACHYSPYGLGLSNCPHNLPQGAMLILNDRTPACGHDPALIVRQLSDLVASLKCGSILLDFQRPDSNENAAVAKAVTDALPCPVGVSDLYAKGLGCPVFLPPVPLHVPPSEYLSVWQGREIWLEAALTNETIAVTEQGAVFDSGFPAPQSGHSLTDKKLYCHYITEPEETQIRFQLFRTPEDLRALLEFAENQGVTQAIGLYQELTDFSRN